MASKWIKIGALSALVAVGLGAFGAHGLQDLLVRNDAVETWKTASFYHLAHSLAILLPWSLGGRKLVPAVFFIIGILLFSGSLYVLCLTGIKWLGAVTPLGGLAFMAGWLMVAFSKREDSPYSC